jgi:predicted TIM-barrel fold metal-dependent hydrolase
MNKPVTDREVNAAQKLSFVDCDIHPVQRTPKDLHPYLSAQWREHSETFGAHLCQGLIGQLPFPRMMAAGMRADAYPSNGGPPGSDLELMQRQHLDLNGCEIGMLIVLSRAGMDERNLVFGAALAHAANDWQLHEWVAKDNRLKAAIVVPQEHPEFAVREIDARAAEHEAFRQVIISPRSSEPLGRRKYWPIYEAVARNNLVLGLHPAGSSGGHATSGTGWGTYYMQEHYGFGTGMVGNVVSLIIEGVFEQFPALKVAMIESGFSWAPSLGWRMDKQWERNRKETPHLKRPPSEYLREHFWFCTQPMEEPEKPEHLQDVLGWIGWDKLMYSSDYPHWDYDDPRVALNFPMTLAQRAGVLRDNARALYRLP